MWFSKCNVNLHIAKFDGLPRRDFHFSCFSFCSHYQVYFTLRIYVCALTLIFTLYLGIFNKLIGSVLNTKKQK